MTTNSKSTKTEELLMKATDAFEGGKATEIHLGYNGTAAGTYVVQLKNSALKQLVELCRLQHEALITACLLRSMPPEIEDALAAYEHFERGE